MNPVLALRLVGMVLSQMAAALNAPRLRRLRVDVVVSPTAETAATGYNARRVEITLPWEFHGIEVERDNALYLALIAHEIGHLPDLVRLLETMANMWDEARIGREQSWWPVPPGW